MGWPRDHTRYRLDGSEFSDARRYAFCGNGMAAPVMRWLGERLTGHRLNGGDMAIKLDREARFIDKSTWGPARG